MQIAKGFNKELISEVALRCNDIQFNDFPEQIYGQASYREERNIAREYSILERVFTLKVEENDETIVLPLVNFKTEYKIEVNDIEYNKVHELDGETTTEYVVKHFDSQLILDYLVKTKGDIVKVYYISMGNTGEEYEGTILIPPIYYAELLRRVCIHIARLGIAKFTKDKKDKYISIYKLYQEYSAKEPDLAVDKQWIQMKPFTPWNE